MPDVSLKLTNVETGVRTETATSSGGLYNATPLIPGRYRISVQKTDFETSVIDEVTVSASQTVSINVSLKVGQASTTVTVVEQSPLLTPATQAATTTVEQALAEDLPYSERSVLSAALLVAGVKGNPTSAGQVSSENPGTGGGFIVPGATLSVGGAWPGRTSILVDGSDVTQASFPRAGVSVSAAPCRKYL